MAGLLPCETRTQSLSLSLSLSDSDFRIDDQKNPLQAQIIG
jgi:hypothetical protein